MADDTKEKPSDNPENSSSENSAENIIPNPEITATNPDQEPENMEVHHHSHSHKKKNWKSYIWEFLMLFFAVFCGYLAEYKLEHTIEHNKEKEYIVSMIEDAKTDTANIRIAVDRNKKRALYADTLMQLCFNYEVSKNSDSHIYRLYRKLLSAADVMTPTERTLLQLMNSGGMRLIRNKIAADHIISYEAAGKQLLSQQAVCEKFQHAGIDVAFEIMNFHNFNPGAYLGVDSSAKLLIQDKVKLIQFGNRIAASGGVLSNYIHLLQQMNDNAIDLIGTLSKEYNIEKE